MYSLDTVTLSLSKDTLRNIKSGLIDLKDLIKQSSPITIKKYDDKDTAIIKLKAMHNEFTLIGGRIVAQLFFLNHNGDIIDAAHFDKV
jgi:hypothetical protein